ncbi:HAD family hydrolase [Dictyobacter aurantiacus]|uniref:Haloacid dehalogenase n=1 Tax=Dictyobacter aurantiacus TaxID=1936993 RepID=A0A401ZJQ0_9CHLR|nr:HAD family hydrolase [Dictyobacter aurantiacus]GCE07095.1 hypothetical protein KDAU_44240 [Dictyobacter aurantiacus]
MGRVTIFLDDGGVMNDNALRGPQWRRLVGEFFPPRLGGTALAWAEANLDVMEQMFEPPNWERRLEAASDYASFYRQYGLDWLGGMCALLNISCPVEEECIELVEQANAFIIPRVRSAFPGAAQAIRRLYDAGYTLHTASGEPSNELAYYLEGMEVRDCFGRLYGPDLIDTFKLTPRYYERVFADLGIEPAEALIVDDRPDCIDQAARLGAHTVLIGPKSPETYRPDLRLASLAELPEQMQRFDLT